MPRDWVYTNCIRLIKHCSAVWRCNVLGYLICCVNLSTPQSAVIPSIRFIRHFVLSFRKVAFQPLIVSDILIARWKVLLFGSSLNSLHRMNVRPASIASSLHICPSASILNRLHLSVYAMIISLSSNRSQFGRGFWPQANFKSFETSVEISCVTLALLWFPSIFIQKFRNDTRLVQSQSVQSYS